MLLTATGHLRDLLHHLQRGASSGCGSTAARGADGASSVSSTSVSTSSETTGVCPESTRCVVECALCDVSCSVESSWIRGLICSGATRKSEKPSRSSASEALTCAGGSSSRECIAAGPRHLFFINFGAPDPDNSGKIGWLLTACARPCDFSTRLVRVVRLSRLSQKQV